MQKKESFPRRTLIETILSSPNPATGLLAISWKFKISRGRKIECNTPCARRFIFSIQLTTLKMPQIDDIND